MAGQERMANLVANDDLLDDCIEKYDQRFPPFTNEQAELPLARLDSGASGKREEERAAESRFMWVQCRWLSNKSLNEHN